MFFVHREVSSLSLTYSTVAQETVVLRQLEQVELGDCGVWRDLLRQQDIQRADRRLRQFTPRYFGLAHKHDAAHHVRSVRVLYPRSERDSVLLERSERQLKLFAGLQYGHKVARELHVLRLPFQDLRRRTRFHE